MRPAPRYRPGTRIRLWRGETATIVLSNDTRLRIKPDKAVEHRFTSSDGSERVVLVRKERDISPDTPLEVLPSEETKRGMMGFVGFYRQHLR